MAAVTPLKIYYGSPTEKEKFWGLVTSGEAERIYKKNDVQIFRALVPEYGNIIIKITDKYRDILLNTANSHIPYEIAAMAALNDKPGLEGLIPRLFSAFDERYEGANVRVVVMQYFVGAIELDAYVEMMKASGRYTPEIAINLRASLMAALHRFHTSGYVHRDIHPKNILVVTNPEALEVTDIKFIDLELSIPNGTKASVRGRDGFIPQNVLLNKHYSGKHKYTLENNIKSMQMVFNTIKHNTNTTKYHTNTGLLGAPVEPPQPRVEDPVAPRAPGSRPIIPSLRLNLIQKKE